MNRFNIYCLIVVIFFVLFVRYQRAEIKELTTTVENQKQTIQRQKEQKKNADDRVTELLNKNVLIRAELTKSKQVITELYASGDQDNESIKCGSVNMPAKLFNILQ